MKSVRPVYDKDIFEMDKNKYLLVKKNISTSSSNYRERMQKSMHDNAQ
jgi:hypothetical protein